MIDYDRLLFPLFPIVYIPHLGGGDCQNTGTSVNHEGYTSIARMQGGCIVARAKEGVSVNHEGYTKLAHARRLRRIPGQARRLTTKDILAWYEARGTARYKRTLLPSKVQKSLVVY